MPPPWASYISVESSPMAQDAFPIVLHTARLVLRPYALSDVPELHDLVLRNYPDLLESFPKTVGVVARPDGGAAYIRERLEFWVERKAFWYGLWLRDGGHIGQLQVKNIDWGVPSAELGYFVDAAHRGHGYAAEALGAILKLCLQDRGFKRLYGRILPNNVASMRLVEKLGFAAEGRHQNEFRCGNGKLHDTVYYAITEPVPPGAHPARHVVTRKHRARALLQRLLPPARRAV